MGVFSWVCPGCHHSIRNEMITSEAEGDLWMSQAVYLDAHSTIRGSYDGYGRIEGRDLALDDRFALWHVACWDLSGRPAYNKAVLAEMADDQGHFIDPDYNPKEPRQVSDLIDLRVEAKERKETV